MSNINEHDTKRLDKLMEKGALEQWAAIQIRNLAEQRIKDTGKIERLGAALNAVYHHAPINPEYGYQGVDADAMQLLARKALASGGET